MALNTLARYYSNLGLVAWGDLNEITIYRSHRGPLVFFPKTYPDKPLSEGQKDCRKRWTQALINWAALTKDQKAQWELATHRASLCMTGCNLYVHWYMTGDDTAIHTLERQTRTILIS